MISLRSELESATQALDTAFYAYISAIDKIFDSLSDEDLEHFAQSATTIDLVRDRARITLRANAAVEKESATRR